MFLQCKVNRYYGRNMMFISRFFALNRMDQKIATVIYCNLNLNHPLVVEKLIYNG